MGRNFAEQSVDIAGDQLTLHNVRNFDYRTETDLIPNWEDRQYDLSQVRSADLLLTYWGSPDIAHVVGELWFRGWTTSRGLH